MYCKFTEGCGTHFRVHAAGVLNAPLRVFFRRIHIKVLNAPLVVGAVVEATEGLELEIGCEIEVSLHPGRTCQSVLFCVCIHYQTVFFISFNGYMKLSSSCFAT